MKSVKLSFGEFKKLVKLNRDKSLYIEKLEKSNKAYEEQIRLYKEFKNEKQKV
jgi:hypothetical protein